MHRTDRLYSLIDTLRQAAPESLTAAQLANALDVSSRTIERDVVTLQEAGVPLVSAAGRNGGYSLVVDHSLLPLHLSPAEAVAAAIALARSPEGGLAEAALSARRKLVAAMTASDPSAARHLANRMQTLASPDAGVGSVVQVLQNAAADGQVVELRYRRTDGTITTRVVEPLGLVSRERSWHLLAWCRTREAHRSYRLDRIEEAIATGEQAPARADSPDTPTDTRLFP